MASSEQEANYPKITVDTIARICRERKDLYETVALNEKMFLNMGGYKKIENLDTLPQLRSLWLDSNNIEKVEGLDALVNLRSLFLQNNHITDISGLSHLSNLEVLDLSTNHVTDLSSLRNLSNLHTLTLSSNQITDITPLLGLKSLRVLDIAKCALSNLSDILPLLSQLSLRSLHLAGNPLSEEPNYRRKVIISLPNLRFLDDRTVTADERRICMAWAKDGSAGELQERENTVVLRKEKEEKEMQLWRTMKEKRAGELSPSASNPENIDKTPETGIPIVTPTTSLTKIEIVEDEDNEGNNDDDDEEEEVRQPEIDYTDVQGIGRLGSKKVMGGIENLFPVRVSTQPIQDTRTNDKTSSDIVPSVSYSVIDVVKKNHSKGHFDDYVEYREIGVNWIEAEREDNLKNMVFDGNSQIPTAHWPEWLCDSIYNHAIECCFDWHSVSDRVQADVCRAVREGRDEDVDAAAMYSADECRLKYFEMEFGDKVDGEEEEEGEKEQETRKQDLDMESLD